MTNELPPAPSWRDSRWLAALEFAIVLLIFVADWYHHIFFSKVPYLFLLGWISLRMRGLGWKSVGLVPFSSWTRTLFLGVTAGCAMEALQLFVTQPLLVSLTGKPADLSDFHELIGNLKLLLIYLPLVWILAACGEEMVYRGYLMNRVAGLFRNKQVAWTVSLIAISTLFGFAHMDQGITGMIDEGLMGLLLGSFYLGCSRSLAVPIIAHGVQDTIDMLLIFSGKYPGLTL
jgi:uncharacterized protein